MTATITKLGRRIDLPRGLDLRIERTEFLEHIVKRVPALTY